jgi:hypothetical protein
MNSREENLYQASRIVSSVADCLIDYASCNQIIEFTEIAELVGRLDLAVEVIRMVNGASI